MSRCTGARGAPPDGSTEARPEQRALAPPARGGGRAAGHCRTLSPGTPRRRVPALRRWAALSEPTELSRCHTPRRERRGKRGSQKAPPPRKAPTRSADSCRVTRSRWGLPGAPPPPPGRRRRRRAAQRVNPAPSRLQMKLLYGEAGGLEPGSGKLSYSLGN